MIEFLRYFSVFCVCLFLSASIYRNLVTNVILSATLTDLKKMEVLQIWPWLVNNYCTVLNKYRCGCFS